MAGTSAPSEREGIARGCVTVGLIAGLVPLGGLLLLLSFIATVEIDSPDAFAGWRDNLSSLALFPLALSVATLLGALAATLRVSRRVRPLVGVVCGLLLVAACYRAYTIAPMLKCWGHNSIARQADGSYDCADR
ncbi:hypothetical protein ACFV0T_32215 [Streptomyces sp. NPDC059582]|uniref:hypothetical protein n=1 Tax=Streptomyces sp. NPDC059582 TaxID=3346875 RepID=UPI003697FE0E